jgi:hypothetical protein
MDVQSLKAAPIQAPPSAALGVPRAPADPFGDFENMTALKSWDRVHGYVPAATQHPQGDLYICWSPQAIYLASYVLDMIEDVYYRDGQIPEVDRATWSVQVNGSKAITMRVGAGKHPVTDADGIRIKSISGIHQDVRCITAIELPAKMFGKSQFTVGDQITLKSTFTTFARASRIDWKGQFTLAK